MCLCAQASVPILVVPVHTKFKSVIVLHEQVLLLFEHVSIRATYMETKFQGIVRQTTSGLNFFNRFEL